MKNEYIETLIDEVYHTLFIEETPIGGRFDAIWINPRARHLGQKHFCEVRELCKPLGIRLEYIEESIVDSHHWYFLREGEDDPTGWLKYRREIP